MWMLFALLSPAIYTLTNYVDKYLLSTRIKDYNALPIYTASVSFIFGVIWWLCTGMPVLPMQDALIVITTGILTIGYVVLYFKALSSQETSIVILLFQLTPIFSLLLSWIILKENISLAQTIGFAIILIATILLAVPKKKSVRKFPKGFWLIMFCNLIFALTGILMKFVASANTFSHILSYESFGMGIGGMLLFFFIPRIRNSFLKTRKLVIKKGLSIIVLNEILFIIAKSLGFYAFVIGPVALVSVLSNIQVFFAIVLGWILTTVSPKIFHEDISKKGLGIKISAAILLFIGLYLLI